MPKVCHEVDFEIMGSDMQLVELTLDPQETVIAEAGSMNYMDDGIQMEARMGDGSPANQSLTGKLSSIGTRILTGESLVMTHFTNHTSVQRRVAFAASYPGKIVALDLGKIGGDLVCQKRSFLCAALGTQIKLAFQKRISTGLFGGEGFILQRLVGDGMAFVHAGGHIVRKVLNNDTILVDPGCLVGYTVGIDFAIQTAGGLTSMAFGGEGMFLAKLSGTGAVLVQSSPVSRLMAVFGSNTTNN